MTLKSTFSCSFWKASVQDRALRVQQFNKAIEIQEGRTSHLPLIYQSGEATRKADRSAEVERKLKADSRAFRQFVPVFIWNARSLDKN